MSAAPARPEAGLIRGFIRWNRGLSERIARRFPSFVAYPSYRDELQQRIRSSLRRPVSAVLEVGGIDRPLLARGAGYHYDGLDIDEQLACHEIYDRFFVQSVEKPILGRYDLIVSMTLLEHVPDTAAAARAMFDALAPGGEMHHYIPGSNHPYAWATRIVGPRLQKRLVPVLRPQLAANISGYPTFFNACTPAAMSKRFQAAGFEAIDVRAYYRANDYFAWFVPLYVLVTALENLARRRDWRQLSSGFIISARRPVPSLAADG